ncbi:MAG: aminoacetone oxidase family FAD-binding enzyme [Lachnospiraceae bacterium]|nr:aminoacetone oxidase family FAD-binding enzyme [Lachnospiraceae bacterium]
MDMTKEVFDAVVAGGGAAGLTAAIFAARAGSRVLVLEQKEKLCKKIYATGNGKCNFTNKDWQASYFRGSNSSLAEPVLRSFDLSDTLSFFREIGIYPKEKNGYYYPNSEQAASVAEALRREAERLLVQWIPEKRVCRAEKTKDGLFLAETDDGMRFFGKSMVLATGGKASPIHGSDGSGYPLAEAFGHTVIPPLPAVVQLKAEGKFFKTLAGVRTEGTVRLHIGTESYTEQGEILFAAYGISGIPVMQLSRYASVALAEKKAVRAELDLFPAADEAELIKELIARFSRMAQNTVEEAMGGLCNHKLNYVVLGLCGISPTRTAGELTAMAAVRIAEQLKHFTVKITGTNGFEQAQACTGGVPLTELTERMESKSVKDLFFVGELTDIDGTCGGYNLQWAWSSGAAAGREIGGRYASHTTAKTKHSS